MGKLGWKTISGALVWGIGQASQPDVLALLPHQTATIVSIVGAVLGAIGVRHAMAKR